MKILIIQQKRIGDVLTSTILCNTLKKKYPDSTIDFMCYPGCQDVLLGNQNIDSIIILSDQIRKSHVLLFKFIFKIKREKYDVVIDVYGKLETNIIALFSGAVHKISYYKWYTSPLYTHNLKRFEKNEQTKYGQAIDNRLLLLKPLNVDAISVNPFPKLYITEEENKDAVNLLAKHGVNRKLKTIMITILGSEQSKTYPLEYMAKVVKFVAQNKDANILFNYFPDQIEDARKIFNLCSKNTQQKIYFDLLGTNLRSFIAIMKQCDVIIGNDGGAINIAKALNKPSFIIFSPHVKKNDWATFEDGFRNISVHLNDYESKLFNTLSNKQIKTNSISLYQKFVPELFKESIAFFMAQNL
jgi:ADP-heptose:LPS heptosyltransferase